MLFTFVVSFASPRKTEPRDPLLRNLELPLEGMYFPLGFRLRIATNSRDVLDAAAESWGSEGPGSPCEPTELRIVIGGDGALAPAPVFRQQGHLFTIVSDAENFAVCDFRSFTGCAFLSQKTAADHAWMRWHFLEAMVQASLEQRYTVALHAACVALNDRGVLLCGASGAGKSTLAFACARAGWTYVSDEAVHLLLPDGDGRTVAGKPGRVRICEDGRRFFPEFRGFAPQVRPNGKVSIEVPLAAFPEIRTAARARIEAIVFLNRRKDSPGRVAEVSGSEAVELLLQEKPFYGEESWVLHEQAVQRLAEVPRYRLEYEELQPAVNCLSLMVKDTRL